MNGRARAGAEEGAQRAVALDLRDEDHLADVLDAEIHGLSGALHQIVHHESPDAGEPPVAQEGGADLEGADTDQTQPTLLVVLHEAMRFETGDNAMRGGGREPDALGEIGERQSVGGGDDR